MTLDILAMAAHPGDVEATCGGTLIRMAERGYRTGVLDLTPGDERLAESQTTAGLLRLAWRDNQNMPDGRLEDSVPARLTLALRIRELRPRVVILPYWESPDPDQVHGSALAYAACFLAGLPKLEEYSAPHRPERIVYASFLAETPPSFVVDISAQFEQRSAALAAYGDVPDRTEALARFHGARIGVRYAEPFVMKEALAIDDIVPA